MTTVIAPNPPLSFALRENSQKIVDFGFESNVPEKSLKESRQDYDTYHPDMRIIVDDMSNYPQIQSIAYHGQHDRNSDDGMGHGSNRSPPDMSSNLRGSLKIVRDPSKTAFDFLPTGETLGAFANRHAVDRYSRKVESKRERARETRRRKRKAGILYPCEKKRRALPRRSTRNVTSISNPGKGF
jgi:hypothetical protein